MSASRLCFVLGTTPSTMVVQIPNFLFSLSLLRFVGKRSSFSKTLHARPYTCPAIAAAEAAVESPTVTAPQGANRSNLHPWPEWVSFIDRLKSQGYFPQTSSASDGGDAEYCEMNLVKDPCLSFARDRYDIFGSLSKGDIQAIVEGGCPKILRKVINSAKRLRVFVGLDESDVCSACSLRGSCDRAYVKLKESEQDARTVDLVRLLLFYALDPLDISGALGSQQVDHANTSARKLLRMLTDLSEASAGLAPLQPSVKDSYKKKQVVPSKNAVMAQNIETKKGSKNTATAQNVEKKGDWVCPECTFMNFSRNVQCRKCHAENPKGENAHQVEMKAGDWNCPQCSFMNFSRNVQCRKCHAEKPKGENAHQVEMKAGDWNCPQCGGMNFARRRNCFQCKEPQPPRNLNPGEWECPKCDFLNFRRNISCRKCGAERVREAVSHYEEQFWRRPE